MLEAERNALQELEQCNTGDTEADHSTADRVLITFIRALGYDNVADAWENVSKWYA